MGNGKFHYIKLFNTSDGNIKKKKNLEDISADWMFAGYLKPPVSGV